MVTFSAGILCLLPLLVPLVSASVMFGRGKYRAGKKMEGQAVAEEHVVKSHLQCLMRCARLDGCTAVNYGPGINTINCQLFTSEICQGNASLVEAAGSQYIDVYSEPPEEPSSEFWGESICTEQGYCSTRCKLTSTNQTGCHSDLHCATVTPSDDYKCTQDLNCHPYWEVRSGLMLPKWMEWVQDWMLWTFKKLKAGTCSVLMEAKIETNGYLQVAALASDEHAGTRPIFSIGFDENGVKVATIGRSEFFHLYTDLRLDRDLDLPFLEGFLRFNLSWCDDTLTFSTVDLPSGTPLSQTVSVTLPETPQFLAVKSWRATSRVRFESNVADKWLYEEQGTSTDPVFRLSKHEMVLRQIPTTNDVTVVYDCKGSGQCNVIFRSTETFNYKAISVCVGRSDNRRFSIYDFSTRQHTNVEDHGGAVLSGTSTFDTITVHYNQTQVTVKMNTDTDPVYTATHSLDMTEIGFLGLGDCCGDGDYGCGYREYRIANHDPAWRTDTWQTGGNGFNNPGWL